MADIRTMAAWCCRVRFLVMAGAQCLLSSNPTYKRVCQRFHTTGHHHHRRSSTLCFSLTATHAATPFTLTIFSQLLLRLARAIRSRRWKRRRTRKRRRADTDFLLSLSLSIFLEGNEQIQERRSRILDTMRSCRILHAKGDGGKPFSTF